MPLRAQRRFRAATVCSKARAASSGVWGSSSVGAGCSGAAAGASAGPSSWRSGAAGAGWDLFFLRRPLAMCSGAAFSLAGAAGTSGSCPSSSCSSRLMVSSRPGGGVWPRGASSSPTPKKWKPPTCWVTSLSSSGAGLGAGAGRAGCTGWGPMTSSISRSLASSLSSASGTRTVFGCGLVPLLGGVTFRTGGAGRSARGFSSALNVMATGFVSALGAGAAGLASALGAGAAGLTSALGAGAADLASALGAGSSGGPSSCKVRSSSRGRGVRAGPPPLSSRTGPGALSSRISPVGAMGVSAQRTSSCSGGSWLRAFSFLAKKRDSSPCLRSGCAAWGIISSGTWATLVVKNVLNFSFCSCSSSSRVSSRRSESLGILVPPIRGGGGPGHCFPAARWDWIS